MTVRNLVHGKSSTYTDGRCRCDDCRYAHVRAKAIYLIHRDERPTVPGWRVRRYVLTMMWMGHTLREIGDEIGLNRRTVRKYLSTKFVQWETFIRIQEAYAKLGYRGAKPWTGHAARAHRYAVEHGGMSPLSWGDIDRPAELIKWVPRRDLTSNFFPTMNSKPSGN